MDHHSFGGTECFWPEQPPDLIKLANDDLELKKKS